MAMFWPIFFSVCVLVVTYVIKLYIQRLRNVQMMRKLGIKGPTPWPIFGNLLAIMADGFIGYQRRLYKQYENERVYCVHEPGNNFIVLRDLDMIRDVCVKNFNNFPNRRAFVSEEPFSSILTLLKGERWKRVRTAVSPTFSTNKLKRMFGHIEETARTLVANLTQSCQEGKEVELKDISSYFTMDVIASTGFGVKLDSINDRDNEFMVQAKTIMSGFQSAKIFLLMLLPKLYELLKKINVELLPDSSARYFHKFADEAIANRQKGGTLGRRHDFLQLMMDAEECPKTVQENGQEDTNQSDTIKGLTRSDIQGQTLIFLLAGYDTVSITMSFFLFLLAQHPEVCKKVQEELDRVLAGKFPTYECVQELTYLDMCFNEALRMFPPGFVLDRECTEECTIQGVHIPKGVFVMLPVMAIHYDPKIWSNPEKFDPERFSPENKEGRHPFAHIPFGQGPRNCIGMRLAILEIKVAVAAILQKMSAVPCAKSVYPVVLDKNAMKAKDGLWVKFVYRNQRVMS